MDLLGEFHAWLSWGGSNRYSLLQLKLQSSRGVPLLLHQNFQERGRVKDVTCRPLKRITRAPELTCLK
jgi:hypothetical protein